MDLPLNSANLALFSQDRGEMFYNFKFINPKKLITNLLMKPEDCSSTLLTRESGTAMALS